MFYIIIITALVLLASYVIKNRILRKSLLPPGPKGTTFFGVAFQLDPVRSHLTMGKWADEYGDMFAIKMFGADYVVLNSYETIHESLVTKSTDFAGRPSYYVGKVLFTENSPSFNSYSPKWLQMKKRQMQCIRMYGDENARLGSVSSDVLEEMLSTDIKQQSELGPVDFRPILSKVTTSIMASIIFGKKMDDDFISKTEAFIIGCDIELGFCAKGVCLDVLPSLRFTLLRSYYNRLTGIRDLIRKPVRQEFEAIKENYIPGEESCFAEGILSYTKGREDKDQMNDEEMLSLCTDTLMGGIATTSNTLLAVIALLVNHPEIQTQMRKEITAVVGNRRPCLADRSSMPYTEAVILEVLRLHTVCPLSLVHKTMCITSIKNYAIPAGTNIMYNLWHNHHDAAFWDEPWKFQPERFLDAEGQLLPPDHPKRTRLLPFGAGRRVCPGELMGRNRIWLIMTSFLQNFEMLPEDDEAKRPQHDPRSYVGGILIWPQDYKVKLKWFE